MPGVHISPYQGSWYPESAAELAGLLEERFAESCRRTEPYLNAGALGFVVPHAGPAYSGTVAAAVYRCIRQQRPERVVLLAFPHHGGLRGIAVPDVDAISTPLGDVAMDRDFGGAFPQVAEQRLCDHSFEIQLPFLQKAALGAPNPPRVAPLYVGRLDPAARHAAADALAALWRPGTVFIASSDFTHYGRSFGYVPFPPDEAVFDQLHELDRESIEAAGSGDAGLFLDTLATNGATVCGAGPIALLADVLARLQGDGIYQTKLDYQTSGEISRDCHHSVSYAALAYFPRAAFELAEPDREALLDSAAETLRRLRETGTREPVPARNGSPALCARRGVFVSLHQGEELLGCLGNCAGRRPLAEEVADLALAAALEDPRFRPAAQARGPVDIEISVLTPFRRIRGIDRFTVGRHGGFLKLGGQSGLLLPQVAEPRQWTAEDFLKALARKSRLAARAWQDPKARLSVFEAQVFARPGQ